MDDPELALGTPLSRIELLHCASLVHDDLPCFDAARCGAASPSVQCAFGEQLAVLAGDALIVLAFEALAKGAGRSPQRLAPLVATLASGVGLPCGIAAGQAWECEPAVDIALPPRQDRRALHRQPRDGRRPGLPACEPVRNGKAVGARLGDAYQAADDIRDVRERRNGWASPSAATRRSGRPSLARDRGLAAATRHFDRLIAEAERAVPDTAAAPRRCGRWCAPRPTG